ncbi:uncharacterized protein J3R85_010487 [Psidium guajava]|nr:uncharacterized protein J3R85_010487 [Psidium guajava]
MVSPTSLEIEIQDFALPNAPGIIFTRVISTLMVEVAMGMAQVQYKFVAIFLNVDGEREGSIPYEFFGGNEDGGDGDGENDGLDEGAANGGSATVTT